jgi:Fur family ferric uptake transcriptional regulator
LAAHGLRRTAARLAVLQALADARHAVSHAELEVALPGPVDRVTLYRVLDSLVDAGLATRHVGGDRTSRFSLADGGDHGAHSHFHCDDCGRVFCMPFKPPRKPAVPPGFALEGADLRLHGHCPDCTGAAPAVQAQTGG